MIDSPQNGGLFYHWIEKMIPPSHSIESTKVFTGLAIDLLKPGHIIVLDMNNPRTQKKYRGWSIADQIGLILSIIPDIDSTGYNHKSSFFFEVLFPTLMGSDRFNIHWLDIDVHKSLKMCNIDWKKEMDIK